MGQLADILEFRPRHAASHTADWEAMFPAQPARLVIGSYSRSDRNKQPEIGQDNELGGGSARFSRFGKELALLFLPDSLRMVYPSLLGTAMVDLVLVGTPLLLVSWSVTSSGFSVFAIISYLLLFFIFAAQAGLYRDVHRTVAEQQPIIMKTLLWSTLLTVLAQGTASTRNVLLPLALIGSVSFCTLVFFRWFWSWLCGPNQERGLHNVLVIGNPLFQREIASALELEPCSGRSVKAFLSECDFQSPRGPSMLRRVARQQFVDEVIVATRNADVAEDALQAARGNHLDVSLVHTFPDPIVAERVGWITLLKIYAPSFPEWRLTWKRIVDVALASVLLVLTCPLLLLIALGIKLDSRGPVLYRAERIGYRGHRFTCNKFRTMRASTAGEKDGLRSRNERQGAFFKILKDPRITRFGRFLRRYSLDELPQLWNVVRGEMSLIGPRPHPPDDVRAYGIEDLQRLDCVPGMTGLWQVTARQDPSFERCVALDVEYIKHWSPLLDIRILCKTLKAVLQGGGA